MIIIIDNYDSFTYNLYQMIAKLYSDTKVYRNDKITSSKILSMDVEAIIISPGPKRPEDAGNTLDIIKRCSHIPMLGVCLGHQAIAQAYGSRIIRSDKVMHGKASKIYINNEHPLFLNLNKTLEVGRYHSLIVDNSTINNNLSIIATTPSNEIMAIAHKTLPLVGVQFHLESILTKDGLNIIINFITNIAHIKLTNINNNIDYSSALKPYLYSIIEGNDLSSVDAYNAMSIIMSGCATDAQIGSFITALRMKGETIDEISGFAKLLRSKCCGVSGSRTAIDIVGTGGDLSNSFNVSTTSAIVVASAGMVVAKHGNRSVSSSCGSADVLEALNVNINLNSKQAKACLDKVGISFLFAQEFHSSMRYASSTRKEIGVRSVFNILGPLANPALSDYILLGVYDESLLKTMGQVLINLGIKAALIVHGNDGLDEISVCTTTKVCEVRNNTLKFYQIDPLDYGIEYATPTSLVGGTPTINAEIAMSILNGHLGPTRDIVLLNAGSALYISNKVPTIRAGIQLAKQCIDSGAALNKLKELSNYSNSLSNLGI
ncbi:MAG: anthranilate phosphoribosyltransferase [Erysipelotrichaceae bacterium]